MQAEALTFMGHARDHAKQCSRPGQPRLDLVFPGDPMALRKALKKAMEFLRGLDFGQDACGVVELVLAEAINNVIEHAYAGERQGVVELIICQNGPELEFRILDDGLPMPGDKAPAGHLRDLDCDTQDLPEGGFGWFLIHELTSKLEYRRAGTRNQLQFVMQPAALTQ